MLDGTSSNWENELTPSSIFPTGPRYGAYLRCIPPCNRVGDYVHCNCRVVNIFLKRLLSEFTDQREAAPLKDIITNIILQSQGLPLPERLAPRHTKTGTLDLTAATLFVTNIELHGRIGICARTISRKVPYGQGHMNMGVIIQMLCKNLHQLHSFWRQKTDFSEHDLTMYNTITVQFGKLWHALGWKVSTWVHWVVKHSVALATLHKNIYLFSSIPTERRNVEFKLDVTHCYKGWKLSRPYACTFGFAHVLNLSALDVGIMLYAYRKRGQKRDCIDDLD